MKAQTVLSKIVLIPPGGGPGVTSSLFFEQKVEVLVDNYNGTSFSCGTSSPSIFTNFEFDCSKMIGYQVTIKSIATSASILKLCSVGILSNCDCTQTSFLEADLKDYGPKIGNLTVSYNGIAVTGIVKTGDAVSYVCGSATGVDYCGTRTMSITVKQNGMLTNPTFVQFSSVTNQLTL